MRVGEEARGVILNLRQTETLARVDVVVEDACGEGTLEAAGAALDDLRA
jgi:hypothetical protein